MLPIINNIPQSRLFTEEFKGLHAGERAADGEFTDILNFTSDDYPVLSTRRKRKKAYPIGSSAFPVYAAICDDELGVVMVRVVWRYYMTARVREQSLLLNRTERLPNAEAVVTLLQGRTVMVTGVVFVT